MTDLRGRVLLYSGGMDSVALDLLEPWDVLLYVNMHTRYSSAELARLPKDVLVVDLPLGQWERPDAIVPLRNLLLVAVAAQYGSTVGMAATAGDRVLDKSPTFAHLASGLLSYLWQPQHWTDGKQVDVVLPVKQFTKRQLVQTVGERTGTTGVQRLAASWSCYTPTPSGECGRCKPCMRKWVAFAAEGYGDMVADAEAQVRVEYLPPIQLGTWDRGQTEADDVLAALGLA